ncbi:uncharacterized protein EV154DRAFT_482814 [Mucor mucedo]|uniref:uncharacterized protein n=1 Tax=Mucor mucedo TaxID=29922 RepID=UPI00221F1B96|nr:uncharacterized protein EV154DRAFT_482814 [Mucor mucedo]KAI7889800.1 hypothetical protein EV154DRAFT_482814 [Mucor mucedo]
MRTIISVYSLIPAIYSVIAAIYADTSTKPLSKVKNIRRTEAYYHNYLVKYEPHNNMERNVSNIYKHIIEQHLFRSFMLTQAFIGSCSEQSLNIKVWSHLFECFFGRNPDLFLQWDKTRAADCTAAALDFKLDLRITVNTEKENHEVATAELAKLKSTTESKLYNHKLKLALGTECLYKGILGSLIVIDCTVNQEHSGWCTSCLVQETARQGRKRSSLQKDGASCYIGVYIRSSASFLAFSRKRLATFLKTSQIPKS